MSIRTPGVGGLTVAPNAAGDANNPAASDQELAVHRFWGRYDLASELPNAGGNAAVAPAYDQMRPGDVGFVEAVQSLFFLQDRGTSGGADAVWNQLSAGTVSSLVSAAGAWTVPVAAAVGDLVYGTGAFSAARADNTGVGTSPAIGVIVDKPAATTATVAYFGSVGVFAGLTPAGLYYLGATGGITLIPPAVPGSVVQRVGVAADATTLIFNPGPTSVVI